MKDWDKREKRLNWRYELQKYLRFLDFGWLYQRGRKMRAIGNIFVLNVIMFIVINVVMLTNYGLWWLIYG